jgi:hypothetical protein
VLAPRVLPAAEGGLFELLAEVRHQSRHPRVVCAEAITRGIDVGLDARHD